MAVYDRLTALDRVFLDVERPKTHMRWDAVPDLHDFVVATDASFRELCDAADAVSH